MTFFCSVYHVIGKAHNTTTCCDTNWPRRVGTLLIWGHQSKFTQTETYKRSNQQQGKQIVLLSLSILTLTLLTFSFSSSHLKDMITQLPAGQMLYVNRQSQFLKKKKCNKHRKSILIILVISVLLIKKKQLVRCVRKYHFFLVFSFITFNFISLQYRALLSPKSDQIPVERRKDLQQVVLDFYGTEELSTEILQDAAEMDFRQSAELL